MTEKKIDPELDLNLEKGVSLDDFLARLPERYFEGEAEVSAELMRKLETVLKESGKKEVSKYPLFDLLRGKENGVGTIIVDFSKIQPQENFMKLAEEERSKGKDSGVGSYEYYAKTAYNLAISVEILSQLLQFVGLSKSRLKSARENKHFAYDYQFPLHETMKNAATYNEVNAEKTTGFPWNSFETLLVFAKHLRLKKFVVVFTNTQDIPEFMRKNIITKMNRYSKDKKVSGILLRKEEEKE